MKAEMWAGRLVVGLTIVWALALAVVFALRLTFPLELEWMEDGALQQALRLQRGEPIYGPPNPAYVPYLYTPLYSILLAGLGVVSPLGFVLGRLVSIGAVLATCFGLWRIVRFEGKPLPHRAAAVGLFLSSYVFCYRWLDLARIDATFIALVVWALALLREGAQSRRKLALAGLLMALAFWTKQTAFVFVLASGAVGLLVAPRRLWIYVLVIAVVAGGGVLVGNAATDGWLWTYIYELHQSHAFNEERFRVKTWGMFAHAAPFMVVFGGVLVVELARAWMRLAARGEIDPVAEFRAGRGPIYWGVVAAAGFLVSALGYSTQWAEPNAFIPGVCFGAAFVGVVMPGRGRAHVVALGLVAAQLLFALLVEPLYQPIQDRGLSGIGDSYAWQRPTRTIPGAERRARAARLRAEIESTEGELLALHRPWWNVLAGGDGHVGSMGINDVPDADARALREALREGIEARRYAAIWLEGEPPGWMRRALGRNYVLARRLQGDERVRPMSGYMSVAGMVKAYRRDQLLLTLPTTRPVPDGATVLGGFEDRSLEGWVTRGRAFGRRPVRSVWRDLPAVGPIGGEWLLSSAASSAGLGGIGSASSPVFTVAAGGRVELLLGAAGPHDGLEAAVVEVDGDRRIEIPIPRGRYRLSPVVVEIPADWHGVSAQVVIQDESEKSAVFVDDVWLTPA